MCSACRSTPKQCLPYIPFLLFFFFNDTATTEIYTLSLHDALPISCADRQSAPHRRPCPQSARDRGRPVPGCPRSEEHTSELQSQSNLVCRLLLEKKKKFAHPGLGSSAGRKSCGRDPLETSGAEVPP